MSDNDTHALPRRTVLGGLAGIAGLGVAGVPATGTSRPHGDESPGINYTVEVSQSEGQPVNWVLPGPRRLSEEVFGTPDNPLMGEDVLEHAKEQNPEMADFLDEFPTLVAVPEEIRETNEDGSEYTVTSEPTAFGDDHRPVEGTLDLVMKDRSPWAGFRQGRDEVELDVQFTDPAGNTYRGEVTMLDRKTKEYAGGVLVGGLIHGNSGTGSPLFPKVYNYGSLWGVGTLDVNDGEATLENRVVHFMTTQMARDHDYALAVDEELPLAEPYLGRSHHTHGFFFPIRMTADGPEFDPLDVPFPPDADEGQPFVHIMYDMDDVTITTEGRSGDEGSSGDGDDGEDTDEANGGGDDNGGGTGN